MKRLLTPLGLALFLLPISLSAATRWTAVPSTGAIDATSLSAYSTSGAILQHALGSTTPVIARYNVTNLFASVTDSPGWDNMELGYFDNAPGSSVSATLYQVNPCTGNRTALCTVTSVDSSVATCASCNFHNTPLHFDNFLYYVEVTITRNSTTLTPSLRSLRLYD